MPAISSRHTRSIAGARSSWYFVATWSMTRSSVARGSGDGIGGDGKAAFVPQDAEEARLDVVEVDPRVNGSSFCSGSISGGGSRRWIAESRN